MTIRRVRAAGKIVDGLGRLSWAVLLVCMAAMETGCGSNPTARGSGSSGSTTVTILSTSTANDQLSAFAMVLNSLTLTDESGATINLLSTPLDVEFMHVNGTTEPLLTESVPQGVYVSATATAGIAGFACVGLNPSGSDSLTISYFEDATGPDATVNLPAPITITGANMGLLLDLLVSESASWTSCSSSGSYSITPTFSLRSEAISSKPTNSTNGMEAGLKGVVASVNPSGGSLTVTSADGSWCEPVGAGCGAAVNGPVWKVVSNGNAVYQGISGISQLAAGMPVEMDASLQPGGSLQATRIAVYDNNASDLTLAIGPLTEQSSADVGYPDFSTFPVEELALGPLPRIGWSIPFSFSASTTFQVSSQLSNLQDLPFPASFSSANMVAGQNFYATTHALSISAAPTDLPATTVTLIPQTINGTVSAIGSDGGFTAYTVTLAPYDLFPQLAVQSGQATLLTNPNTVVVYADDNTQILNTNPIAVGSVVRFYGLVFNDNGTLRMDCAQINDGVPE